jgi:hypothetical protein
MRVCPNCGFEEEPIWLNHQWQQHIEYCSIQDFRAYYPALASKLTKPGTTISDSYSYYRLTNRGTFVYRWPKKLGPDAYHWNYEAARKKGVGYLPQTQQLLEVIPK